ALTSGEELSIADESIPYGTTFWGVSELGELNHESDLSNVIVIENNVVPLINNPVTQVTTTESNFVRFEWEVLEAFTGFHYQWASDADIENIIEENDTLATSYAARLFNNLEFGKTYYFRLRASNSS